VKFFRRFCLIILIYLFAFSVFPLNSHAITVTIPFNVEVAPNNAGSVAEYRIYGSYSEYDKVKTLKVYFRADTGFKSQSAPSGSVLVNNIPALGVKFRKVEDSSIEAILSLSQYINKGDKIEILFKKEAGIVNPTIPAVCYKVRVALVNYLGVEVEAVLSHTYRITSSVVQGVTATVDPAVKGMKAEYTVNFTTGVRGTLRNNDDIKVKFPEGTILPNFLHKTHILINGQQVSAVYRDTEDPYVICVFTPIDISANYPVTLVFEKEFGISNTVQAGSKTIMVSTKVEPDWVESAPFNIASPKVQNLSISLNSDIITMDSSIHIGFATSPIGSLIKGKSIYINFPDGFALPGSIDSSFVTVNGKNAEVEVAGRQIIIHTPENIGSNADVIIGISDEAHIANPASFGDYAIEVQTDSDSYTATAIVSITQSSVKNVVLDALYSGTGTKNEFNITFITGSAGGLTSGVDYIKVGFGNVFEFPENIHEGTIFINDIPVSNVSIDVYSVIATVPLDIEPNSEVKVKMPVDFGIRNPKEIGDYILKVSTSKETAESPSNALTIIVLPVVEFTVAPSGPDGENGFYKSKPSVQLSSSNGGEVYFKVDDGEFLSYGGQSIVITEGEHKIFAYAVDETGNKGDVYERNFKVDTTPPTVNFGHGSGNIYVNTTHAVLTGSVSEPCELKINSIIVAVADDLSFSHELDVTNNSPLAIYMKDLAGNSVSIMRTVYLDEEAPVITMLFPDKEQYSTADETVNIRLKLSEEGTVTVNSKEMDFDGSIFSITVNLYNGENNFYITAADAAGNKTTKNIRISRTNEIVITLQIGSGIAYVGSEAITLDTAPIIQNGRTLVPLRFIMETFGAAVDWNGDLKIITITQRMSTIQLQIGSSIAWIDGSNETLDTPPIIQNERTFVPVRFIAEALGATVDWDGATKTITITYTP
jgi:hypothetical protein